MPLHHKVVGLVSGGKDSTFNLLHCVANGHEIVALATLTPEIGIDELDSHMYQSVGTTMGPMIAQAMRVPHYSGTIKGKAVAQDAEYGNRRSQQGVFGDETEDLYDLLQSVLRDHSATAVASGAILSNYQRSRVEHVASRLNLVSLSYLWQQPQLPLIEKMVECGMDVILVKVAGIGLGVDCVGKTLKQMLPTLRKLYGSHPAGEGGEYETLTLSTPLFESNLAIVDSEVIVTDPEPSLVAYLKVRAAELCPKPNWCPPTSEGISELLGPFEIFDRESGVLLESLSSSLPEQVPRSSPSYEQHVANSSRQGWTSASALGGTGDIEDQIRHCFEQLPYTCAVHVTLLLSDMALFARANAVYKSYFGASPPSRITVAVPLPPGRHVAMHMLANQDHPQTLHVQSLSYWAPANIGPYSQATSVSGRVFISGQVPLVPATLEVIEPSYRKQSVLALQHTRRIVDVLRSPNSTGGGWRGSVESCTVWWARVQVSDGWRVAVQAWDLWSVENNARSAPVVFLEASGLPRDALVEFQVNVNKFADALSARSGNEGNVRWEAAAGSSGILRGVAFGRAGDEAFSVLLPTAIAVKMYYTAEATQLGPLVALIARLGCGFIGIPVHSIHDRHGKPAAWAVETMHDPR